MICNKCNNTVQDGAKFCPICGNSLVDTNNNQTINVVGNGGMAQPNMPTQVSNDANVVVSSTPNQDKANVWLAILSWFIPLAGLIIYFVKKKTSPKTAKVSGICALISFILNCIIVGLTMFLFIGTFNTVNNIIDETNKNAQEIIDDANDNIFDDVDVDDNSDISNDSAISVSSNWKDYKISVGNKVITLPTTYNELSTATKFVFKESSLVNSLENNYYTSVNMYNDDKLALYVEVFNNTGTLAKYVDCKITRVSQTAYQIKNGAVAIVFPGGIKAGDVITEDKIISLFGIPNDTNDYSSDNYNSKTYTYVSDTTWTTTNNFKITVVNGVIDEIQLDHRN